MKRDALPASVPFLDLKGVMALQRTELLQAFERVLDSGWYILGNESQQFEAEWAAYCGAAHAVGVANGLDALILALQAVGVNAGDEVIVPANTYIATWLAVSHLGATPVPVEPDPHTCNIDPARIEAAITPRTRAILPVHLYGCPAPVDELVALARARGLAVVEDAAQAIGATLHGRPIGSWGDAACLSFYPTKNLGACGDAGMVVTDRADVAERLRRLRHHGDGGRYRHVELGYCSRLDEMQAALLRVKLRRLDGWTEARRRLAARYREALAGLPLRLPVEPAGTRHIYHLFTVRHPQRDAFVKVLDGRGVGTAVHYPLPVPGQPMFGGGGEKEFPHAWRAAREVVSLPCFPELTDAEVSEVIAAVKDACARA